MGDKFDQTATRAMPAGTFGFWPAEMKHFAWANGETVLQLHGTGPWMITYLNPADDPRRAKKPIVRSAAEERETGMNNTSGRKVQRGPDLAAKAKGALERVCSGKGLDSPSRYYSKEFVDHVNDMKFHGLEGARRSVELYTKVLSDLDIVVEEQLRDGDRVTSRFVVSGKVLARGFALTV